MLPNGSWQVGGLPILHEASLRRLKAQLVFEADGAYISDGQQRISVEIDGPAFEVVSLRLDAAA